MFFLMAQDPPPPFPSPEELKVKITEFMKQNFGDRVSVAAITEPEPAAAEEDEKPEKADHNEFEFNLLPRDIKAHLDRFVIKQDEAKKVLAIAVCDHYNHANHLRRLEKENAKRAQEIEYIKQNVILVGPTGVGKTYLIKHIADLIHVPFVKADATKFSETGYVGGDVEDLVRELVHKADGDLNLAQFGIIYIDEIDKIAGAGKFIGRLPVRVVCEDLDADDLFNIMKCSEGSLLRQYERAFRAYGIQISFEDEALRLLAEAAAKEMTGARGLLTVFEKLFRDYKYYLAGSGLTQLRVTADLVREPQRVLDR